MRLLPLATALLVAAPTVPAQEILHPEVIARIDSEETHHSHIMEIVRTLSDVHGPRLAGSRAYHEAALWARDQLAGWGLIHVALESWGRRGAGWELDHFSVEMTAPRYLRVTAVPYAWSPSLRGTITGTPVLVSVRSDSDFARYHGTLRGKIVMNGVTAPSRSRFDNPSHRLSQAELDSLAGLEDPGSPRTYWEDFDEWLELLARRRAISEFFRREGAVAVLEPSRSPLTVRAQGYNGYGTDRSHDVPVFVVADEHYGQIAHVIEAKRSVTLVLSLRTHYTRPDSVGYNIVAELPGTDRALGAQVVMLGGHFDSWHAGTGATDNGAGVAVAMEIMRVLRAIGVQPRRTIRLALWDGEEQEDYFGSMGYVKRHFGDPYTMALKPEHALLSAYFNLDNGTGKIRGIYAQGNAAAKNVFSALLQPLKERGAGTVTIANTGSTDHMPFTAVGLPGFELIQDPLDYETRTHHTALDVADDVAEDDLKQAVVVLASLVYHTAMRDGMIPRLPLPAPHPHTK